MDLTVSLRTFLDIILNSVFVPTSVSSSYHVSLFEIKGAAVSALRVLVTQFQRDRWKTQRGNTKAMASHEQRCPPNQ